MHHINWPLRLIHLHQYLDRLLRLQVNVVELVTPLNQQVLKTVSKERKDQISTLVSVRETANENEIGRARENVNGSVNGTFLNSFLYLDFCCTCVVCKTKSISLPDSHIWTSDLFPNVKHILFAICRKDYRVWQVQKKEFNFYQKKKRKLTKNRFATSECSPPVKFNKSSA